MNIKNVLTIYTVFSLAFLCGTVPLNGKDSSSAQSSQSAADAPESDTTVRADQMDFDFENGKIFLEGEVIVKDKKMVIRSNQMTVFLNSENRLRKVIAEGNVRILQPAKDRKANAGHAVYEVSKGTVVLTKSPRVEMEGNTLQNAKKITFYRNSKRVETVGSGTKLHFKNQGGQGLSFSERNDDADKSNSTTKPDDKD